MATVREISGGFFAECPGCGGHRYLSGEAINGRGEAYALFTCDAGCNDGLASLDVLVEWNETWDVLADETGRRALHIWTFDETEA